MPKKKQYPVQSFKRNNRPGIDPYAMEDAPKGILECPECHAMYYRKRWSLSRWSSQKKASQKIKDTTKSGKAPLIPQPYLCPACRKIKDGYAEGFVSLHWPHWLAHKANVLNLIHNEERQACHLNPLERIMGIRTRSDGADIETTTEHMAQRLGRHLVRAFKGEVQYKWSKQDKLARVYWNGPKEKTKRTK